MSEPENLTPPYFELSVTPMGEVPDREDMTAAAVMVRSRIPTENLVQSLHFVADAIASDSLSVETLDGQAVDMVPDLDEPARRIMGPGDTWTGPHRQVRAETEHLLPEGAPSIDVRPVPHAGGVALRLTLTEGVGILLEPHPHADPVAVIGVMSVLTEYMRDTWSEQVAAHAATCESATCPVENAATDRR